MSQLGKAMSKKKYYENVILIKYNVDNALKIADSLCKEVWGECQCCGINNPPEVQGCIRYNLQKEKYKKYMKIIKKYILKTQNMVYNKW